VIQEILAIPEFVLIATLMYKVITLEYKMKNCINRLDQINGCVHQGGHD